MREKLDSLTFKAKLALKSYPWIKLSLLSFMGMLGGTTVVAFINKYAIYNYMLAYGARLPLEGVDFLDVAVSVMSLITVLISLCSVLLIYFLLSYIASVLHKFFSNFSSKAELLKVLSNVLVSLLAATLSIVTPYINDILLKLDIFESTNITISKSVPTSSFITSVIVFFIIIFLLVYKPAIKYFAIAFTFCGFSLISVSLFNADKYSNFLNEIKYGGGIPVVAKLSDDSKVSGSLIINTKSSLVLWDRATNQYTYVMKSKIKSYSTNEDQETVMPLKNGNALDLFTHFI
ncbi:hypothetical protein HYO48_22120 [Vibrio parahaemolyticus]|nr:hypothetical protein [Vibrio parahaemolyticus]